MLILLTILILAVFIFGCREGLENPPSDPVGAASSPKAAAAAPVAPDTSKPTPLSTTLIDTRVVQCSEGNVPLEWKSYCMNKDMRMCMSDMGGDCPTGFEHFP